MADPVDNLDAFPEPIQTLNFEAAGRKVVQWAQDPSTRPRDLAEFKAQLDGLVVVPDRYKEIQIVQGYDHVFFLRLPPNNQVTQSQKKLQTEQGGMTDYGIPDFYFDAILEKVPFNRDSFFYSRIADYTIRGCR
ncbi:hypothetical protein LB543_21560 [Mesorhizobium sp. ESP7-2]|uniref:hypothetical protein n=1 Tax=Mesorhizobium sp. ESP7-2 TaxID=2876622 RepID=UPI001CCF6172|nr:hypothetical protein [Mesorhizobium sp. ESP7-2]MBZ9709316.1 hypothetical protein [Mesorhizobium sp. ESP7-2]